MIWSWTCEESTTKCNDCLSVFLSVCMNVCMYVRIYVWTYRTKTAGTVHIYICTYIYVYVYIYSVYRYTLSLLKGAPLHLRCGVSHHLPTWEQKLQLPSQGHTRCGCIAAVLSSPASASRTFVAPPEFSAQAQLPRFSCIARGWYIFRSNCNKHLKYIWSDIVLVCFQEFSLELSFNGGVPQNARK